MKTYKITVDGYYIGECELSIEEVKALASDKDIHIQEV